MRLKSAIASRFLASILCFAVTRSAQGETAQQPARFGAILTLSGNFASAGEDCRKGLEAGLGTNSTSFQTVYADSRNSSADALSEFQRLTGEAKALAIFTHRSSIGMALNPVSQRSRVPLIGAVGHQDFATTNRYAFQAWPSSDQEGRFVAERLIELGQKEASLIYTEDEWTSSVSTAFRDRYKTLGGVIFVDEALLPGELDMRSTLMKSARLNPNAALFLNLLLPQIVPSLKQKTELQIAAPLYFNFYLAKPEVREAVGEDVLNGVHYVEINTSLPKLSQRLGLDPEASLPGLTVASYVAGTLMAQALHQMPAPLSTEAFYSALLEQREVRTEDAIYPIHDRRIEFPLVIKTMEKTDSISNRGKRILEGT